MRKTFIFHLLLLAFLSSFAQQKVKITGKVTDQDTGEPIIGANVGIKNTTIGVVTNSEGIYNLTLPSDNPAILVFRYLGYNDKEVAVNKQTVINVTLKSQDISLNQVVVIGYGSVAKKDVTGSVSSVNMADLDKAPVRSFEEALAGRIAGVQVSSESGKPGSGINILIRGANSLTQDNSPLWVVDGFPLENPDNNNIDPSQIESIEVLKDASATAIYGARGANGVIIITTKKGVAGKPKVNFNSYYGFQQQPKSIPVLSPYEFVKLQTEVDPIGTPSIYFQNGRTLESYRDSVGIDWQDALLRTAPMSNYNLTLSGGTDKTKYLISGNILGQDGVIINSGFNRKQLRVRLDQDVSNKIKTGINISYNNNKSFGATPSAPESNFTAQNYLLYSVWGYRPIQTGGGNLLDDLIDPTIDPTIDYRVNPILSVKNELRQRFSNNFNANAYGEYLFSKALKLRVSGGINSRNDRNEAFNNSLTRYGNSRSIDKVNGSVTYTDLNNWLGESILTYNKIFNKKNNFTFLAGVTGQGTTSNRYGAKATNLPNESLGLSGLDEGVAQTVVAVNSENTLLSYLSRVNYSYNYRYLFTASFRADGSSKFREKNRWSYFPSAAFAWRAINEKFLKKLNYLSDAKVRVSYGVTGNNRVTDFATYSQLSFANSGFNNDNAYYAFNNTLTQGVYPVTLSNADLKWENTTQTNIGLDLGFFKQRIALTADYYLKTTSDLLLNADLPGSLGYTKAFKNIGKTRNEGLELSLNTVNIDSKSFSWNTSFTISFNKNKVLALTENQESLLSTVNWDQDYRNLPAYIAKIGQPIGQMYGFIWDGLYQTSDFTQLPNGTYVLNDLVPTNGNSRSNIQPGDIKYKDLNGDGVVDDDDKTIIGRAYPIHQGGLGNNFKYKNFDLNVFLQWSYGNDIINANRLRFENGAVTKGVNQYATYANRWSPTNTTSDIPRVKGQGPTAYSSRIVEDGSYLRLKTVSLGYNFPAKMLKRAKISDFRVYASTQNLFTITNYSGYDPEVAAYNTALTPSFDYSVYPRASTIVFGLNITL
ncbi:TonB-dependent receptor [Pedobacter sp. SD-b]|uniref:TonB-dependent receptor n=1 Tax=Pedobacter segetis TaxID=2793069 RepID=A0ABS1BMQ1_9SPHI|nr:TonB-dependent receptor [Pedobacter segetis]MBK0384164.1 TonB-dependent receptor [Pedobacter segetis]